MLRATQSVIGDLQQAARIVGREQAPDDWGRLTVGANIASGGEGVPIKTLDAQAIAPCPFLEIFRRKLDQETVGIDEIGRASCRASVCQYETVSVVAVSIKKKKQK